MTTHSLYLKYKFGNGRMELALCTCNQWSYCPNSRTKDEDKLARVHRLFDEHVKKASNHDEPRD